MPLLNLSILACTAGGVPLVDGGFLEWLLPRLPGPAELAAARAPQLPVAQLAALDRLGRPDRESATLLAAVGINADVRTLSCEKPKVSESKFCF